VKPEPSVLQGEPLRVYRTLPARVIGWSMAAAAVALAVLTVVDLAAGRQSQVLAPVALVAGVAAVAWVLFLRPAVRLHADGLVVINVVTETTVPFAAVEEVGHRWALEVRDVRGRTHSAWAVPVRRDIVRRRGIDDFAETTRRRGHEGVTAQGVTDEVLRAMQRWRLDGGEPAGDPPPVVRRVSWAAVAVLAGAAVLAVGAVVL
jgi:hypothetical protein